MKKEWLISGMAILLFFCVVLFSATTQAQVTHRGMVVVRQFPFAEGQEDYPQGVAVDASGNVYSTGSRGTFHKDTLQPDGTYSGLLVQNDYTNPIGITVDSSGNVYIVDSGVWYQGQLLKNAPSSNGYHGYDRSVLINGLNNGYWQNPRGLAQDSSGTFYFGARQADYVYVDPYSCLWTWHIGESEPICTLRVSAFGVAADANYVYFTDTVNNNARRWEIAQPHTIDTIATGLSNPKGIAVDSKGNVYISDTDNDNVLKVTPDGSGGFNPPVVLLNAPVDKIHQPAGLAVDQWGNLYIALGAWWSTPCIVKVTLGGLDLGTAVPGVSHDGGALTFLFNTAVTLNATTPSQVLTQGVSGQDFTDETYEAYAAFLMPDDCVTPDCVACNAGITYNAGASCRMAPRFSPLYSGTRNGAVVLFDSDGNAVNTAYLHGTGKAAQITFSPGTQSVVASGFQALNGVAVDGSGNVYIVDTNNRTVLKETPSGNGYTPSLVASGLVYPVGVALDGARNVYISDGSGGQSRVLKETLKLDGTYAQSVVADNSPTYGLVQPLGVAVDGSGNVYIVDAGSNQRVVKETLQPDGTYIQSIVVSGLSNPSYVAVDGRGNVYITDTYNHRVLKETLQPDGTYAQSVVADNLSSPCPLSQPHGVAVDGSGNVYISDSGGPCHAQVLKETLQPDGTYSQSVVADGSAAFGLQFPLGIAVDAVGNVYIADAGSTKRVLKENRADAPALNFGNVSPGSSATQSVEIINNGNDTLTLSGLTIDPDSPFTQVFGSSTLADCGPNSVLTPGAACNLSITFTPQTNAGSYSVTATVNDPNYQGSASGTFVINSAAATVALSNLTQTYTGSPLTPAATTSPAGLSVTWTGAPQTNAGSYSVTATVNDPNYQGSASGTFVINSAAATVTLSNLTQTYTGSPLTPTATTSPVGLSVTWTGAPQTNAGSYSVTATVNDPNYQGSASGTFMINKATPTISWSNPADIGYGTPLSGTQLNATASVPGTFAYTPPAGTLLNVGLNQPLTVLFTPTDVANYSTATKTVPISVRDMTPPTIGPVSNVTIEATSAAGAVVNFNLPTATDTVDPAPVVTATPPSGSTFPLGTTTVTVMAQDAAGNASTKTFTVTVRDTTPPVIGAVSNVTSVATSPAGAVVTFALPTVTDLVDPAPVVTASPASGSTFPIGTTTVTVTARDAANNTSTKTFTVTVYQPSSTPGRMHGEGWLDRDGKRAQYEFDVRERATGADRGSLWFSIRALRSDDDHADRDDGSGRRDRFESTMLTDVVFYNLAGVTPGGRATTDTVVFKGIGRWNGARGYAFTATAVDAGEPGPGRDSFAITITATNGTVVATVSGIITHGNNQSNRVNR